MAGNQITETYVILDEMALKPGMIATRSLIEFDRNRIYNLGLFTQVELFYDSLGTIGFLYVDLRERWYVIPFPIFGFRDGDPKRAYYGAGLLHNNVAGKNKRLALSFALGDDPVAGISFMDPLLHRDARLFGSASVSYSHVRNKSEDEAAEGGEYDEDHFSANVLLGKRLSLFQTGAVSLGYRSVSTDAYRPGRTVDPSGNDRYLVASLQFTHDTRDLAEYATQGALIAASATQNGVGESHLSYSRFALDLRGFLPLGDAFILAGRGFGSFAAGGTVPVYGRTLFGFGERIRGHYRDVTEGEHLLHAGAELRFLVLPPRTVYMSTLPLPEQFRVWRFGIACALFGDAGTTWFRGEPVGLRRISSGVGGGVHFLLPYGLVARIEYAINDAHRGEWIIDFRSAI